MVYTDPGENGSASSSWARGSKQGGLNPCSSGHTLGHDPNSIGMAVPNKTSHAPRAMPQGYPVGGTGGSSMPAQYRMDGVKGPMAMSRDLPPDELLYCPQCSYTTYRRTSLVNHLKTHTGEKPFACDHCSFRCSQKVNLQRHKLTHSGDKPYACPYCPHRGRQKIHIEKHVKVAHKDKVLGR